jgi:tyrosinase
LTKSSLVLHSNEANEISTSESHKSPRFLAWHRHFLHVYEQTLRNKCGYKGRLPYWNWTLDWQHLLKAPVWGSDDLAFGTNGTGEASADRELLRGSCLTDGPFANTTLHYLMNIEQEHCLSRGFASGEQLRNLSSWLRPKFVEQLLLEPQFEQFNERIERFSHLAIPAIVQGDFVTLTSPNGTPNSTNLSITHANDSYAEPLLFLHHSNLDRLWWLWQRFSPGRVSNDLDLMESVLPTNGLAPDIRMAEVMNTRSGPLCYEYN